MKIRTAVFPVAGLGTRFLPATKAAAKELFPLVDKPVLQYGVEEAAAAGIEEMVFVISKDKPDLTKHFSPSAALEAELKAKGKLELLEKVKKTHQFGEIKTVYQDRPRGLGHAVLQAQSEVKGDYFAVLLPDDIMACEPSCLKQMIEVFRKVHAPILAVEKTDRKGLSRYGIVGVKPTRLKRLFEVTEMVEKPGPERAPSNLAIVGRYILPTSIFDELRQTGLGAGGEIQLTDALVQLLEKGKVYALEYEGEKLDAGEIGGYIKAMVKLALEDAALKEDLADFIKRSAQSL